MKFLWHSLHLLRFRFGFATPQLFYGDFNINSNILDIFHHVFHPSLNHNSPNSHPQLNSSMATAQKITNKKTLEAINFGIKFLYWNIYERLAGRNRLFNANEMLMCRISNDKIMCLVTSLSLNEIHYFIFNGHF